MRKWLPGLILLLAAPAYATGGLTCSTAGGRPISVSMVIGHVPGSPLAGVRLTDNGRIIATTASQWWIDQQEVRLILTGATLERELILRARRSGDKYDGSIWRAGQRRWVRCRES